MDSLHHFLVLQVVFKKQQQTHPSNQSTAKELLTSCSLRELNQLAKRSSHKLYMMQKLTPTKALCYIRGEKRSYSNAATHETDDMTNYLMHAAPCIFISATYLLQEASELDFRVSQFQHDGLINQPATDGKIAAPGRNVWMDTFTFVRLTTYIPY